MCFLAICSRICLIVTCLPGCCLLVGSLFHSQTMRQSHQLSKRQDHESSAIKRYRERKKKQSALRIGTKPNHISESQRQSLHQIITKPPASISKRKMLSKFTECARNGEDSIAKLLLTSLGHPVGPVTLNTTKL